MIVKAGNPKHIKSPNDLSGKKVAVHAGTKYEEYLKDLNDQFKASGKAPMSLNSYPGDANAIAQVVIGRADAVLTQDTEGAYQKSDAKLGNALKSAIATLKKNGTLKKLAIEQQIPVGDVK